MTVYSVRLPALVMHIGSSRLHGSKASYTGSKLRCMIILTSLKISDSSDFFPFTVPFFPFLLPAKAANPYRASLHMESALNRKTVSCWQTTR